MGMRNTGELSSPHTFAETWSSEAPRPNRGAYEVLGKYLDPAQEKGDLREVLGDIYKLLEFQERNVIMALNKLETSGVVRREDTLVLVVLLAVSRTLGPDLDFLRQAILSGDLKNVDISGNLSGLNLDGQIINYLRELSTRQHSMPGQS